MHTYTTYSKKKFCTTENKYKQKKDLLPLLKIFALVVKVCVDNT